ncbi:phosphate ABC transporter permease PstA [Limnobacter sp.]|uniref:phosphate ABC transporter permease PstA n=1 Tax=Limnobacter sp. TaxID=2003368 RepID=UPI00351195ED
MSALPKDNLPRPADSVTTVVTDERVRNQMQTKRRWINMFALTLSLAAMAFGLFWLIWILWTTVSLGIGGLSWELFTEMTPPPGVEGGGLANAIVGTLLMVGFATLFGTPLGIMAGVHLAESRKDNKLASSVRFINDILLSAPSIVIGLFVYAVMVRVMGHFSAWAGVVALALIQIPIVIRTTENMLRLVPDALREAAFALGTPKWKMVMSITVKASYAGILTGILLSVARIAGETAPLLFTALSNQFWNTDMMKPMANLPVMIFNFALSPFTEWQQLAWAGVFLITAGVLVLNIIARSLLKNSK